MYGDAHSRMFYHNLLPTGLLLLEGDYLPTITPSLFACEVLRTGVVSGLCS